jgi:hypothetical protein
MPFGGASPLWMPRLTTFLIASIAMCGAEAGAQSAPATLSVSIPPMARLSFSTNSISFPDADPDLFPQVSATQGPIAITAKARAAQGAVVTLTVQASDDLRSGVTVLPASLVTWTGAGPGFSGGTLSRAGPQLVGTWTGSGVRSGTQSYQFENRWTHPAGTYTITLVYTLSVP